MPQELQEMVAAPRNLDVRRDPAAHAHRGRARVSKVRLLVGEPLTRRGILDFVRQIPEIPRITSIGLSTKRDLARTRNLARQDNGGSAARCRCAIGEYFTRYPRCRRSFADHGSGFPCTGARRDRRGRIVAGSTRSNSMQSSCGAAMKINCCR